MNRKRMSRKRIYLILVVIVVLCTSMPMESIKAASLKEQFWNAKLVNHNEQHYVVQNDDWNSVIKPDQATKIGFEGFPGNLTGEPHNFKLTAASAVGDELQEPDAEMEEDFIKDTDQDGLIDAYELELGTDILKKDTDGDGLSDFEEVELTFTDPTKKDMDENGILDGMEDTDQDGLNNFKELELKTHPGNPDSDQDGIKDFEETAIYFTNPNVFDTDGDKLGDGDEIVLKLNPLKPDTDGNGILDSEEKILQVFEAEIEEESNQLSKVTIQLKGTGNINNCSEIRNRKGIDAYSDMVPGLVGVPVEIRTLSNFAEADIQFTYDNLPIGTKAENLGILWFNEKNGLYEVQQSQIDKTNKTVSIKTTHFSTYLLVDLLKWNGVWEKDINYVTKSLEVPAVEFCFLMDNSKSMNKKAFKEMKEGITQFIQESSKNNKMSLISYDGYSAQLASKLISDKKELLKGLEGIDISTATPRNAGTTTKGLKMAVSELIKTPSNNGKYIILFSDDDMKYDQALLDTAKENNIKIFVCNLVNKNSMKNLRSMIAELGGYYYTPEDSKMIFDSISDAYKIIKTGINTKDTDQDGLFDVYEKKGIRVSNGELIKTNYQKADSDGDGVTDFDEMRASWVYQYGLFSEVISTRYIYSSPLKKDSDGDGYADGNEEYVPITSEKQRSSKTIDKEIRKADNTPLKYEVIRGFDELGRV